MNIFRILHQINRSKWQKFKSSSETQNFLNMHTYHLLQNYNNIFYTKFQQEHNHNIINSNMNQGQARNDDENFEHEIQHLSQHVEQQIRQIFIQHGLQYFQYFDHLTKSIMQSVYSSYKLLAAKIDENYRRRKYYQNFLSLPENAKDCFLKYDSNQEFMNSKQLLFLQHLGTGAFSEVFSVVNLQTEQITALKIMKLNGQEDTNEQKINYEIKMYHELKSEYITNLINNFEGIQNEYIFQLQYIQQSKTLHNFLNSQQFMYPKLPIDKQQYFLQIMNIIYKISSAICFFHQKHMRHGDLKPQNILYAKNENQIIIKILDLGSCRKMNFYKLSCQVQKHQFQYTPKYSAHEIISKIQNNDENIRIYMKSDIYALGIMFFKLIFKKYPELGQDREIINFKYKSKLKKLEQTFEEYFQEQNFEHVCQLIEEMTKKSILKRLAIQQVISRIQSWGQF